MRVPKLYKLVFVDHDGLEVRARAVPIGKFLALMDLAELKEDADPGTAKKAVTGLLDDFSEALVSWNLEECPDGECTGPECPYEHRKVPADDGGVKAQDVDFMMEIIDAWMTAIAGTPPPLPQRSTSGGPFLEVSIPMEPLSVNHLPLPAPS